MSLTLYHATDIAWLTSPFYPSHVLNCPASECWPQIAPNDTHSHVHMPFSMHYLTLLLGLTVCILFVCMCVCVNVFLCFGVHLLACVCLVLRWDREPCLAGNTPGRREESHCDPRSGDSLRWMQSGLLFPGWKRRRPSASSTTKGPCKGQQHCA